MENGIIKVFVTDRNGTEHELEVPIDMGLNMMEVCKMYELGVKGTCGGMALCASCHLYVESDHELHEPSDDELNMLDSAFEVEENSRLGCQLKINKKMDGLRVRLAKESIED